MCFPGPGCLQATQLASRILASGLLVHGSGQKNKRLKCSSVWHGGDCGPFFSLQVGRQTCRTHTCMHTHDICTHPHTQERTHAHITTAIVKGDLAEHHATDYVSPGQLTLQRDPPVTGQFSFLGGYLYIANSTLRPLHSCIESGHDSPTQLGTALFPCHPVIVQSLLRTLGNSGITPPHPHHEREHSGVGHSTQR